MAKADPWAQFADDIVAQQYDADEARAKTFAGFAGLAIFVACLGLYGLAAFTAERRRWCNLTSGNSLTLGT